MTAELAENVIVHDPAGDGTEFFYARIQLSEVLLNHLLHQPDGTILRDGDHPEMTFYKYARTPKRAAELPKLIRSFAAELESVANDVDQFLETYAFPPKGTTEGEREQHN